MGKKNSEKGAVKAVKCLGKRKECGCPPGASTLDELCEDGLMARTIAKLRRRCLTVKEIGRRVHKSDHYVSWVLNHNLDMGLGIPQVRRLRAKGLSIKEIAHRLGIGDRTVAKVVRAHFRACR